VGPIGIGQVIGKVSDQGIIPLIHLVALLSISLGLINLFFPFQCWTAGICCSMQSRR